MKIPIRVEEDLLKRVVDAYGYKSKSEAVEMALKELDRKVRHREFINNGSGFIPCELTNSSKPC